MPAPAAFTSRNHPLRCPGRTPSPDEGGDRQTPASTVAVPRITATTAQPSRRAQRARTQMHPSTGPECNTPQRNTSL
ncbi:hypothetical protein BDB00DRAFT_808706, partial [Zychaea mexicana]|uniref:uncharacterized protein n=1 Tax=Zychaea mexicana TaxID=64656 RepID=UPI0022FEA9A2